MKELRRGAIGIASVMAALFAATALLVSIPAAASERIYTFFEDDTDAFVLTGDSCAYIPVNMNVLEARGRVALDDFTIGGGVSVRGEANVYKERWVNGLSVELADYWRLEHMQPVGTYDLAAVITDCDVYISFNVHGYDRVRPATPVEGITLKDGEVSAARYETCSE